MLILSADDVRTALPMSDAVAAMKRAFVAVSSRQAIMPPRAHLDVREHDGVTLVMPSLVLGESPAMSVKTVSVFAGNPGRGLPRIQAAVLVVDPSTGTPAALLEGSTLTSIRTAAASGAATDVLARQESETLAILGAGVEARTHIRAMCAVRAIREVRIYSPRSVSVQRLISDLSGDPAIPALLLAAESPAEALRGADIICTVTTSTTPVFETEDVPVGVHINAVGSFKPHVVEIPAATVASAKVVVDSRDDTSHEAGDLIQAVESGAITRDHVLAEVGELLASQRTVRSSDADITLFKSVGVAVQDAVAARLALDRAEELGLGQRVKW